MATKQDIADMIGLVDRTIDNLLGLLDHARSNPSTIGLTDSDLELVYEDVEHAGSYLDGLLIDFFGGE